ncbi:hypothetical protein A6A03_04155 [Chloroflexus islandicus]|uniref:Uncharacterized protein n=1 Tax=Chloroflexus islandicus TaxID=1707952 RepID=A0A178LZP5_9CHLR|nr:hypothetical protein [Chloroflexus islandicus]OAN40513.1 hypothetical protein A6A03_04155 [Chloroflexus islandicus]
MRQPFYVIDALAAGYATVHRQPFILLFSIGLSAYLWLGSAITLALPSTSDQSIIAQWIGTLHAIDARTLLVITNLIPLLTPGAEAVTPPPLVLATGQFGLAVIGLNAVALALSSVFLASLRQLIRPERPWLQTTLAHSVAIGIRLAGAVGIALSIVALPLVLSIVTVSIMPETTLFFFIGWIALSLIGLVIFGFTPEIITLQRYGPLAALQASWHFARRRWFPIATFLAICTVIEFGFANLWRALAMQPGWLAPAIVGNAYIGSGLRAARLQFYQYYAKM